MTGASGFVGAHLIDYLCQYDIEVWGTFRKVPSFFPNRKVNWVKLSLDDKDIIKATIESVKPDVIFHLAAQSNVRRSWSSVVDTFQSNVIGSINLLEALKEINREILLVNIGSSEEYGPNHEGYIKETSPTRPVTPYGISKLTVAQLALQYHAVYGLPIIHVRPFNHIGPGQAEGFVTSDFAKQIVEIELADNEKVLSVGNLDAVRDFTDVRDIVKAYYLLALQGRPGEIYNVCKGVGVKISDILNILLGMSKKRIKVIQDPDKLRPSEIPVYVGDNSKLVKEIGWDRNYSLEKSLEDILIYWRNKLKGESKW
jgi:GDP-4-dehydro-6-deoxy-D-mannose reductase